MHERLPQVFWPALHLTAKQYQNAVGESKPPRLNPSRNSTKFVCPDCGEPICDMCGGMIGRFSHSLTHEKYPKPIHVCADCAERLTGFDVRPIERRASIRTAIKRILPN